MRSFTEIKLVIQLSTTCKHLRNENEDDKNEEGRSEYDLSAENETFKKLVCIPRERRCHIRIFKLKSAQSYKSYSFSGTRGNNYMKRHKNEKNLTVASGSKKHKMLYFTWILQILWKWLFGECAHNNVAESVLYCIHVTFVEVYLKWVIITYCILEQYLKWTLQARADLNDGRSLGAEMPAQHAWT